MINTYLYGFNFHEHGKHGKRTPYAVLFEKAFTILGDVGRKHIRWVYQYGYDDRAEGRAFALSRGYAIDMCKKQTVHTKYS